jgi:GH25 family lysozyme M1 (1,4-beta-N-acetylmuramidase)
LHAGAYHFFDYRKPGRSQARHFLATLRRTSGLDRLLPLVVDVETLSSLGQPDPPAARSRLHALLDELYRQTGRYPMIYTSQSMWRRVVGEPLGFGPYPLWVACWKCDVPLQGRDPAGRQCLQLEREPTPR